jgi:hypothetical protein
MPHRSRWHDKRNILCRLGSQNEGEICGYCNKCTANLWKKRSVRAIRQRRQADEITFGMQLGLRKSMSIKWLYHVDIAMFILSVGHCGQHAHNSWRGGRTQSGDSQKARSCRMQATTNGWDVESTGNGLLTTRTTPNNTKQPLQPLNPPSHCHTVKARSYTTPRFSVSQHREILNK